MQCGLDLIYSLAIDLLCNSVYSIAGQSSPSRASDSRYFHICVFRNSLPIDNWKLHESGVRAYQECAHSCYLDSCDHFRYLTFG